MEIKKAPKADLEKRKQLFLMMGYVFILSAIFVGFEWSTKDVKVANNQGVSDIVAEEEIIPITRQENTPPPPPPPAAAEQVINIVDNTVQVADVQIKTSDDDNSKVEIVFKAPVQAKEEDDEQVVFTVVEDMPQFPGGDAALMSYIAKAVKYPTIAQENGIQGRVICAFVVNKDGHVTDAEVLRGVDPSLDKEALRVINSMPIWKAGKQRGKPVRVKYTLPVNFRLQQ
ncbi:MAG: energy transducer TonB [Bacteroidales bacterium]|nr:energy transducer TonB [Bacteroidales bacterium]